MLRRRKGGSIRSIWSGAINFGLVNIAVKLYTAAPYSLRPRPGAMVSTPLEWKEVRRGLDPQDFNIRTIPARIKKKGDLWKGVLGRGIDIAKALKALKF